MSFIQQKNIFLFQELSSTSDTSLVKSLINLIDCMMDEFHNEEKIKNMKEDDVISWLEVCVPEN